MLEFLHKPRCWWRSTRRAVRCSPGSAAIPRVRVISSIGLGERGMHLLGEFLAEPDVQASVARTELQSANQGPEWEAFLNNQRPELAQAYRDLVAGEHTTDLAIEFDPTGDTHYDLASALIKSIRGSDPDAALYWLARMLEGGEDIRFITRRLIILASEDIGNADPSALSLAVACMQACEFVGLPECQLTLSQAVTYLACAPKSNAATIAIDMARQDVREARLIPVPTHLRDGHYDGASQLGHGAGYEYAHDAESGVVAQDYLGVNRIYYRPVERGFESELQQRLRLIRKQLGKSFEVDQPS